MGVAEQGVAANDCLLAVTWPFRRRRIVAILSEEAHADKTPYAPNKVHRHRANWVIDVQVFKKGCRSVGKNAANEGCNCALPDGAVRAARCDRHKPAQHSHLHGAGPRVRLNGAAKSARPARPENRDVSLS